MSRTFLVLAAVAAVGLAISLVVHVVSWTGAELPEAVMGLHVAAMAVAVPAMFAGYRLTRDYPQKDYWKAALRGCPAWMRRGFYGFGVYALANFVLFIAAGPDETASPGRVAPQVVRGFSGHWMAFFAAAVALLYSSAQAADADEKRLCLQGHRVQAGMKYCGECGSPVPTSSGL